MKRNRFFYLGMLIFGQLALAQKQPMTLMECVTMALEKNITIKQSELRYQDTEINKSDAKGNFYPR